MLNRIALSMSLFFFTFRNGFKYIIKTCSNIEVTISALTVVMFSPKALLLCLVMKRHGHSSGNLLLTDTDPWLTLHLPPAISLCKTFSFHSCKPYGMTTSSQLADPHYTFLSFKSQSQTSKIHNDIVAWIFFSSIIHH